MNWSDATRLFIADPLLQQRLAKLIVLERFRNSLLEDLHPGISPSSMAGDFSDVVVNSPYGPIPWSKVSRLDDQEMKRLIIDIVDRTYDLIHRLFDEAEGGVLLLRLAERDPVPHWQTPKLRTR
jgi:hypothetical protein